MKEHTEKALMHMIIMMVVITFVVGAANIIFKSVISGKFIFYTGINESAGIWIAMVGLTASTSYLKGLKEGIKVT